MTVLVVYGLLFCYISTDGRERQSHVRVEGSSPPNLLANQSPAFCAPLEKAAEVLEDVPGILEEVSGRFQGEVAEVFQEVVHLEGSRGPDRDSRGDSSCP